MNKIYYVKYVYFKGERNTKLMLLSFLEIELESNKFKSCWFSCGCCWLVGEGQRFVSPRLFFPSINKVT